MASGPGITDPAPFSHYSRDPEARNDIRDAVTALTPIYLGNGVQRLHGEMSTNRILGRPIRRFCPESPVNMPNLSGKPT